MDPLRHGFQIPLTYFDGQELYGEIVDKKVFVWIPIEFLNILTAYTYRVLCGCGLENNLPMRRTIKFISYWLSITTN